MSSHVINDDMTYMMTCFVIEMYPIHVPCSYIHTYVDRAEVVFSTFVNAMPVRCH